MDDNERIKLFNGFALDLARGGVTRSGEPVHLRPQTYEVLKYLVENRGHLISKDKLIEEVWKGRAVTDGSLGKCIEELRDALGPEAKEFIRNVRGRGYIFDTGVDERAGTALSQTEHVGVLRVTVEEHDEITDSNAPKSITMPRSVKKLRTTAVVAGALVLIIATFVGYRLFTSSPP